MCSRAKECFDLSADESGICLGLFFSLPDGVFGFDLFSFDHDLNEIIYEIENENEKYDRGRDT